MKQKISVEKVTNAFTQAVVDDVNDAFNEICVSLLKFAKKFKKDQLIPQMLNSQKQTLIIAIFALEVIAIENLFNKETSSKLINASCESLSKILYLDRDNIDHEILEYSDIFKKFIEKQLNPIEGFSEILYKKLGIKDAFINFGSQMIEAPDPIIVSALGVIVTPLIGRWKIIETMNEIDLSL